MVGQPPPHPAVSPQQEAGFAPADPWAWIQDSQHRRNRLNAANSLLQEYGFQVFLDGSKGGVLMGPGGRPACEGIAPGWVQGGTARLWRQDGRAVLAVASAGRGRVAVFTDSWLFCTTLMGHHQAVPTARQREIYTLEFWLLRQVLQGRTDSQKERR